MKRTFAAACLALLAGCGGAGGGGEKPQPVATLSEPLTTCTGAVQAGTEKCPTTLLATTQNVTSAVLKGDKGTNILLTPNQAAPVMVDVPLGGESYQVVYDNGAGTSSAVAVKPSCAAGAFESPAGCVAKLSYAPVVYGLADLAYPVRVSGTSCASMKVEVAKNETRFQAGYLPHFNAWMRYGMLPSGRLLVSAQMVSDNNARHAVALNPVTNVLSDYAAEEGPVPSLNDPIDPGWKRVSVSDNADPVIGKWAETPTVLVYVPRSDGRILSCKDKATSVVTVLTRELGSFSFLSTYSN